LWDDSGGQHAEDHHDDHDLNEREGTQSMGLYLHELMLFNV
jgi:hypothetical protein